MTRFILEEPTLSEQAVNLRTIAMTEVCFFDTHNKFYIDLVLPAIRAAAKWFTEHLADQDVKVLLLTNDQDNLAKALKEKIDAKTGKCWCRAM